MQACATACAEIEKANKAAENAANPRVPRAVKDLKRLQTDQLTQLDRENEVLTAPLRARKQELQEELTQAILEKGLDSIEVKDLSPVLTEAA